MELPTKVAGIIGKLERYLDFLAIIEPEKLVLPLNKVDAQELEYLGQMFLMELSASLAGKEGIILEAYNSQDGLSPDIKTSFSKESFLGRPWDRNVRIQPRECFNCIMALNETISSFVAEDALGFCEALQALHYILDNYRKEWDSPSFYLEADLAVTRQNAAFYNECFQVTTGIKNRLEAEAEKMNKPKTAIQQSFKGLDLVH